MTFTEACPLAPVIAVLPLGKVAPAPLAGAVNVTVTPLIGFPALLVSVTTSGIKGVLTVALCPEPLATAIISGVLIAPLLLPPQPIVQKAAMRSSATKKLSRFMAGLPYRQSTSAYV